MYYMPGKVRVVSDIAAQRDDQPKNLIMPKLLLPLFLALALVFTSAKASDLQNVSLIQLIANPRQYDGSPVRVVAFLHLEFEGNALYLHREDYEKSLFSNAIWISLTDRQETSAKKISGGYVLVEGIFSAKDRGHLSTFSGSIQKVTRIQTFERRRK
jgi:hypothetical protein